MAEISSTKAQAANSLTFQRQILEEIHDPATSDLLLLARGLGLRKILCNLMHIYESPQSLILLVNATTEEELSIGEELGIMGSRKPGLRLVGYEMGKKDRQVLYKQGGLISVTSRILVVDMLQSDIPIELITGLLVLHAEKVTAISLEAFIIRLFREKNQKGFVKAFSDQPEHITSGMFPLKSIMKELQLRKVHIFPRFHEHIKDSLERRKADVVELHQPMSESMAEIHQAIVQCMSATLNELKRANTNLDLDDLSVENAYFTSFDAVVRRHLDPVWHKVGPKTKQLVGDLGTLRRLLTYLLTYDCLAFHAYLETIISSNTVTPSGSERQHQSPWLFMDAANVIFQTAKRRCYLSTSPSKSGPSKSTGVIDLTNEDEDAWDALDELEGTVGVKDKAKATKKKKWIPDGMDPVLEELPKWTLLADVLQEVEEEIIRRHDTLSSSPGTDTVLVMCSSNRTCEVLGDYLSSMDFDAPPGSRGRKMMEQRLRNYLLWKSSLNTTKNSSRSSKGDTDKDRDSTKQDSQISEGLRKKDAAIKQRNQNRRRVRGGAKTSSSVQHSALQENLATAKEREKMGIVQGEGDMRLEADEIAQFLASEMNSAAQSSEEGPSNLNLFAGNTQQSTINVDEEIAFSLDQIQPEFDLDYGLLAPQETVLLRPYSDDTDDQMLAEIQPRYIIMYEPNQDFVRRIECYRSAHPGLGVRVYFMLYHLSCEEHKYLAGLRREKDSFERLIKERATMLLPIMDDPRATSLGEAAIKTISSRIGGGRQISTEPSRVIVDMREFRSTLPSLLHASRLLVVPATLTVGDYILTPDICVERKSIPDLISSFNSGRLYTQCELMSIHYKQPILLIEFEEHKSFSLEIVGDMKSYVKPTGKYPAKKSSGSEQDTLPTTSLQAKLVLLTLSFPRLRIIWSSSPYATAEIYNDLKLNNPEPDPGKAIATGAEEDPEAGAGINAAAEELLQSLPGITTKNVKYVMSKVGSVREFCELDIAAVQEILGVEPGRICYTFLHRTK